MPVRRIEKPPPRLPKEAEGLRLENETSLSVPTIVTWVETQSPKRHDGTQENEDCNEDGHDQPLMEETAPGEQIEPASGAGTQP